MAWRACRLLSTNVGMERFVCDSTGVGNERCKFGILGDNENSKSLSKLPKQRNKLNRKVKFVGNMRAYLISVWVRKGGTWKLTCSRESRMRLNVSNVIILYFAAFQIALYFPLSF